MLREAIPGLIAPVKQNDNIWMPTMISEMKIMYMLSMWARDLCRIKNPIAEKNKNVPRNKGQSGPLVNNGSPWKLHIVLHFPRCLYRILIPSSINSKDSAVLSNSPLSFFSSSTSKSSSKYNS